MARQAKPRVLLDSSALLSFIKKEPSSRNIVSLMQGIDNHEIEIAESVLIFTEVYKKSTEHNQETRKAQDQLLTAIRSRLESRHTLLFDVTLEIAKQAADLRIEHKLKTADAIHLATAILTNCDWFVTADSDFPSNCEGVAVCDIVKDSSFPWDDPELKLPFEG